MDPKLIAASDVLERVDRRLLDPASDAPVWPTGFPLLDEELGGGLRAGTLNPVAGARGEGKTTFVLQMARHSARSGRPVVFVSFELEAETLLQKAIAAEAAERSTRSPLTVRQVRAAFEAADTVAGGLPERLGMHTGGIEALTAVSQYAARLYIHRSTSTATTLDVIASAVKEVLVEQGAAPLVVVDYLQKISTADHLLEDEKVTRITEGLKDLSIEFECPVVAISASDRAGLEPGTRMRARNMRGSTALAYEADVVLIPVNKVDVVARHHLMYGANNGEHFKDWSVVTIEKNRSGRTGGEVEFRKQFDCGRFIAEGQFVSEKLVDERVYTE
ncbi:DnaB helicase C-terminal domain-containing protein [Nocardioides sp. B-3]|uniref:DnaB helicase C-terminal domain-containing protein n=1 Tax=Nocardioides sp. B-3 TaxID=2895565 RepID=UPI0021522F78|nr:DnaB helicase C-terminal domain-containing protein [Nocardioides sp. B-3]UUZ60686.1 AAA family ATPase [Nocardioides sp. B-3]